MALLVGIAVQFRDTTRGTSSPGIRPRTGIGFPYSIPAWRDHRRGGRGQTYGPSGGVDRWRAGNGPGPGRIHSNAGRRECVYLSPRRLALTHPAWHRRAANCMGAVALAAGTNA